jgi:signal peptide peptidase SppA
MTLVDFLTAPWAILPDRLLEIQAIYSTHLRGEKIDVAAIEARLGRPLANDQQEYEVRDGGVAVLPISGVISNKANMFTRVSGGASAQLITQQLASMRADPRVKSVVLDFDTPGGSVFGIPAMASEIRALSSEKPTVSVSTGMMASAGYWTGSAANAVYLSGETDYMGSIGVVATHNYQPRDKSVTTEITAGKYKRMATDNEPLSKEGRAYLQGQVDQIYSAFVDAVATNRRVKPDQVLERMADGRIFIGQQAIDAGLADGFSTVETMVERMASDPIKYANRRKAVFVLGGITESAGVADEETRPTIVDEPVLPVESETTLKGKAMNPQELAAKFAAESPEAYALIRTEGADAERARIQAVREQAMPGHEKLIDALAFDGRTTAPEAAVQVLAAEKARLASFAATRANDAPAPVAHAAAPESEDQPVSNVGKNGMIGPGVDSAALDAAARNYQSNHPGTSYLDAVKAVQKGA